MILQGVKNIVGLNRGSTKLFNIPKDWTVYHGLDSKDELVYLADEALVIFPKNAKINKDKLIDAIKKYEVK